MLTHIPKAKMSLSMYGLDLENRLQLFVGDASEADARVYATLPCDGLPDDAQLAGELIGPICRYSQTLPARIRFTDRGPGATLLAEAILPDPCFWTPELPFMYTAELRLIRSGHFHDKTTTPLAAERRSIGIRRLGVRGTSIHFDNKRFVFRGAHRDAVEISDLKTAREAASALFVPNPSNEFLREASDEGVLLAVRLGMRTAQNGTPPPLGLDSTELITELARVVRWPAAAIVVLDGDVPAGKELRLAARNTLLAQLYAPNSIAQVRQWAHLLWWEISSLAAEIPRPRQSIPIVAYDPGAETATIAQKRGNCDRLQAELAPLGDFSGYFT